MEEHQTPILPVRQSDDEFDSFWARHRFFLLVFGTIITSFILVVISLVVYNVSGAEQLDLSRPDYQAISGQVEHEEKIDGYSPIGTVSVETIDEFIKMYDEQATKAKSVDAFNGDPLNPETLEFSDSSAAR